MDDRTIRALCTAFCATAALLARTGAALPASQLVVDGYRCTLVGTAGPDVLLGTSGRDVVCGLGGADRISGWGGNDVLIGGAGDDVLDPGADGDVVLAGPGADTIYAWDGARDRVEGGPGDDLSFLDWTLDRASQVEQFR
jgi:Ca2+-binding RTX toxin-like protein